MFFDLGCESVFMYPNSVTAILASLALSMPLVAQTLSILPANSPYDADHVYMLLTYDPVSEVFILANPWGGTPTDTLSVPLADFVQNFLFVNAVTQWPSDVIPPLLGDANGDGKVDLSDEAIVLNNFGRAAVPGVVTPGDLNGDGNVDLTDLAIVQNNMGQTA